jgi:hypothetical protein
MAGGESEYGPAVVALRHALKDSDTAAVRVARCWQQRLSDLGGVSESSTVPVLSRLKAAVDAALSEEPTDPPRVLDAVDELTWAACQVALHQERTVHELIADGRLFAPRAEVVRYDLRYLRRPTGGRGCSRTGCVRICRAHSGMSGRRSANASRSSDVLRRLPVSSAVRRTSAGRRMTR